MKGSSGLEGANDDCVGPDSENAGKASGCDGCPNQRLCASGELKKPTTEQLKVKQVMESIGRVVMVLSGKGGVGKSTVATQLAFGLAFEGKRVGLLDLDICGPSIPLMLGLNGRDVHQSASGWSPVYVDAQMPENGSNGAGPVDVDIGVMSVGFLMPDQDSAVIWRGPRKNGLIQQFFLSVEWGELDYLIIDTPPGTSDEHISVVQLLKESLKAGDGAIVVTTPQEVAMMDVRKELSFCKQTGISVLGVVENMSEMKIPMKELSFSNEDGDDVTSSVISLFQNKCPEIFDVRVSLQIFPAAGSGPKGMAKRFNVPFLGTLPMDPQIQSAGELGKPLLCGSSYQPLKKIVEKVLASEVRRACRNVETDIVDETGVVHA